MCSMDNENINNAWNLLYQILSLEMNKKYNSTENFQQDSQENLLTIVPDASLKMIEQVVSKEKMSKFFDGITCGYSNKLTLIEELAETIEKIFPELKPNTQELLMLLRVGIRETNMKDLNNNNRLLNYVQNFYVNAIKSLPLPIPSETSMNDEAVANVSFHDAVRKRLKKEILPNEIPEILKIIENNDLPTEIMSAPILEDFSTTILEPAPDSRNKYKCQICARVLGSDVALQHHIRRIHSKMKKSLRCELCHRTFIYRAELECHKERHFNEKRVHVCEICDKRCDSQSSLEKHMLCHKRKDSCDRVDTTKHKCKFCEKEFSSDLHTKNHEIRHLFEQYKLADDSEFQQDIILTECQENKLVDSGSYVLSLDRSLCINKATKQLQKVTDIIRPCSVSLIDIRNVKKQCHKKPYVLRECHVSLIDIWKIKNKHVED